MSAFASSAARGLPVEDTGAMIFAFDNGALASLVVSDTAAGPWSWDLAAGDLPRFPVHDVNSHRFVGTEAALTLPRLEVWRHDGAAGLDDADDDDAGRGRARGPLRAPDPAFPGGGAGRARRRTSARSRARATWRCWRRCSRSAETGAPGRASRACGGVKPRSGVAPADERGPRRHRADLRADRARILVTRIGLFQPATCGRSGATW